MGLMRNKRRADRQIDNAEGLICIQTSDGAMKHISREEWDKMQEGADGDGESVDN